MKKLLLFIILATIALPATAEQWKTCKNQKYKYEIQYPENFEFNLTGKKIERDGKAFRISLKDISAMHGINGTILPMMTMTDIAQKHNIPTLSELAQGSVQQTTKYHKLISSKIIINNLVALKNETRNIETNELLSLQIILDNVKFTVILWPGCDEKISEKIISTFKFYN